MTQDNEPILAKYPVQKMADLFKIIKLQEPTLTSVEVVRIAIKIAEKGDLIDV